jgi:5'(3')-deoxyribonucleotidase
MMGADPEEEPRMADSGTRQIVYVDMDGVLVDFDSGIARLTEQELAMYQDRYDEVPGIFARMDPMPGAIEAFTALSQRFDVYILSTASWLNPSAWAHKVEWIQAHFGHDDQSPAYKRLILSHHKDLNRGDYLIDDRPHNGAASFAGELIVFGSDRFPDWAAVLAHLDVGG